MMEDEGASVKMRENERRWGGGDEGERLGGK